MDKVSVPTLLDLYTGLVSIVGRGYLREGKRYMTISVGCTGGKHRSVAIAEELSARLRRAVDDAGHASYDVRVMHRDLGRE